MAEEKRFFSSKNTDTQRKKRQGGRNVNESFHEEDEEGIFRRGVLWALGRMAEAGVNDVEGSRPLLLASLEDGGPSSRGMAAWSAVRPGYRQAASGLKTLRDDQSRFRVYEDGELLEKTVGQSAAAALQVLART